MPINVSNVYPDVLTVLSMTLVPSVKFLLPLQDNYLTVNVLLDISITVPMIVKKLLKFLLSLMNNVLPVSLDVKFVKTILLV
jgi:hypothetical protein